MEELPSEIVSHITTSLYSKDVANFMLTSRSICRSIEKNIYTVIRSVLRKSKHYYHIPDVNESINNSITWIKKHSIIKYIYLIHYKLPKGVEKRRKYLPLVLYNCAALPTEYTELLLNVLKVRNLRDKLVGSLDYFINKGKYDHIITFLDWINFKLVKELPIYYIDSTPGLLLLLLRSKMYSKAREHTYLCRRDYVPESTMVEYDNWSICYTNNWNTFNLLMEAGYSYDLSMLLEYKFQYDNKIDMDIFNYVIEKIDSIESRLFFRKLPLANYTVMSILCQKQIKDIPLIYSHENNLSFFYAGLGVLVIQGYLNTFDERCIELLLEKIKGLVDIKRLLIQIIIGYYKGNINKINYQYFNCLIRSSLKYMKLGDYVEVAMLLIQINNSRI